MFWNFHAAMGHKSRPGIARVSTRSLEVKVACGRLWWCVQRFVVPPEVYKLPPEVEKSVDSCHVVSLSLYVGRIVDVSVFSLDKSVFFIGNNQLGLTAAALTCC